MRNWYWRFYAFISLAEWHLRAHAPAVHEGRVSQLVSAVRAVQKAWQLSGPLGRIYRNINH